MSSDGGTGFGTVFKVDGAGLTTLHTFNQTDGALPTSALTLGANGQLFGSTYQAGTGVQGNGNGAGTLFEIDPSGTPFTTLHQWSFDGGNVLGPLTIGPDGWFYGATENFGAHGEGIVFKMSADGSVITDLHDFDYSTTDGRNADAGVLVTADGSVYGTTINGGSAGLGTVWRIDPLGVYSIIHSFTGTIAGDAQDSDGDAPMGGLCLASDGYLYGTTFAGGSNSSGAYPPLLGSLGNYRTGAGTIYRISPTGNYARVWSLDEPLAAPGNFGVTVTSPTCVQLSWSAVLGAESYHVKRSSSPGGPFTTVTSTTTATTAQDCSLTSGATYYYEVTPVINGIEGAATMILSVTPSAQPAGPANLTAAGGLNQVTLTWSGVAGALGYNLSRSLVSGGPYAPIQSLGSGATTFTDTGRTNGTTYYYVVNAQFSTGTSLNSNQASATPSAPGPANLVATPGNAVVNLAWGAVTPLTNYKVKRSHSSSGPWITLASPTVTTYADTSVTNGTTYFYTVSAVNASGETANSNVAAATPAFPPSAPYALSAAAGNAQVSLIWGVSGGAVSYNIKRSTTTGTGYSIIATIPADLLQGVYTDHTAANGTTYFYVVSAVNAGGESGNSNEATGTPEPPPAAVTDLTATPGNAEVDLTWSVNDQHATTYTILRGMVPGGPYTTVDTIVVSNILPIGQPLDYSDSGLGLQNVDGTYGLENGTPYYYVVTTSNVGGSSGLSNEASSMPFLPVPSIPAAIRAMAGDGSVNVTWSESQDATSYNLYRSLSSGSGYSFIANITIDQDTYSDTQLMNGVHYYYVVTGSNAAGESLHSSEVSAIPLPANLTVATVIQTATNFCQAIGQPVTATPTTQFPAPMLDAVGWEPFWLPRWLVSFPGQAEVEVVDSTGVVCGYYDFLIDGLTSPAGPAEAQNSALQMFSTVILASGQSANELSTATVTEEQVTVDPATQSGHTLDVSAQRIYQNIPYFDQFAEVSIQAETGQVHSFHLYFPAPSPTSNVPTITSAQAQATAVAFLNANSIPAPQLIVSSATVVQPNTIYQPNGSADPIAGATTVAWDCLYVDSNHTYYNVWIDEQTGNIVGGHVAKEHSRKGHVTPHVEHHPILHSHSSRIKLKIMYKKPFITATRQHKAKHKLFRRVYRKK